MRVTEVQKNNQKLLYSNCILGDLLYLSAAFPKSQVYLGEQGRIHQSKQRHAHNNKFGF